jgi:hypothetical protein
VKEKTSDRSVEGAWRGGMQKSECHIYYLVLSMAYFLLHGRFLFPLFSFPFDFGWFSSVAGHISGFGLRGSVGWSVTGLSQVIQIW